MEYDRSHIWSSCFLSRVCVFSGGAFQNSWGVTLTTVCDHGVETDGNKPGGLTLFHDLAMLANLSCMLSFSLVWLWPTYLCVCIGFRCWIRYVRWVIRWGDDETVCWTGLWRLGELSWIRIWNERAWATHYHLYMITITRRISKCMLHAIICHFA